MMPGVRLLSVYVNKCPFPISGLDFYFAAARLYYSARPLPMREGCLNSVNMGRKTSTADSATPSPDASRVTTPTAATAS